MSWEISITPEGWADLYRVCHDQGKRFLAEAIACNQEQVSDNYNFDVGVADLLLFPQDVLADEAYQLIQATNSCDAGGWSYWIDRSGYYKINLPD